MYWQALLKIKLNVFITDAVIYLEFDIYFESQ